MAGSYCVYFRKNRIIELEKIISKSSYYSWLYAKEVLDGRFIEGEEVVFESIFKLIYEDAFLKEVE
jgi:hypothetical protein